MLPEEGGETMFLRLLKRLLEKGPLVSRKEASEYAWCLRLLSREGGAVELSRGVKVLPEGFLMLIKHAVESGVSLENVFKSVNWRGFERIIAEVFRAKGFRVLEHFRFSFKKTVREIDVLVETPRMLVSIDCKQWVRRNYNIRSACKLQFERTRLLSQYLAEKRNIRKAVYPVVITFLGSEAMVLDGCLILPFWKIGSFSENPETVKSVVKPVS
ncbi:MAG: NERD domain-containing protein [Candidatus Brockarchaeota archaeon]|nr:NERD domain-containing protein [Candidatus Brockarchaeota archaeon]MBO3808595.1 NERD domain-containing protein [Candidatus Brockarchaeota archaeon]